MTCGTLSLSMKNAIIAGKDLKSVVLDTQQSSFIQTREAEKMDQIVACFHGAEGIGKHDLDFVFIEFHVELHYYAGIVFKLDNIEG